MEFSDARVQNIKHNIEMLKMQLGVLIHKLELNDNIPDEQYDEYEQSDYAKLQARIDLIEEDIY